MANSLPSLTLPNNRKKDGLYVQVSLERRLTEIKEREMHQEKLQERLDDIYVVLDGLKNRTLGYNDKLVRQVIESVVVESKEKIRIVFIGGAEMKISL